MNEMAIYDKHGRDLLQLRAYEMEQRTLESPPDWLIDALGGSPSSAGIRVSPATMMGFIAYFAAIRNISDDIAKIPIDVINRKGESKRELMRDHPLHTLFNVSPNPEMSAQDFRRTLMSHALGYQGGFAEIVRTRRGEIAELWPLDPTSMEILRATNDRNLFDGFERGELVYRYHADNGIWNFKQSQIFHVKGLSFNGIAATEITAIAKDALGAAMASQDFSARFFGNGTVTSGVIEIPQQLSEQGLKNLRESFTSRHAGSANAHKPVILEQGAKYNQTSTDPEKSQLIETMNFHVENVARLFRIPPHKIGSLDKATFSNIESQAREYVGDTLEPWAVAWEQQIKRSLLPIGSMIEAKHNFRALLRADAAAQSEFYSKMFNIGVYSIDEIRAFEDLNPLPGPGGDTHYRPVNLQPVDMPMEEPEPEPEPELEPEGEDPPEDNGERMSIDAVIESHRESLRADIQKLFTIMADRTERGKGIQNPHFWAESNHKFEEMVQNRAKSIREATGENVYFEQKVEVVPCATSEKEAVAYLRGDAMGEWTDYVVEKLKEEASK